ncbi:MAG: cohesin domain-containing protein [Acidobacteriota bacterium]
MRGSMRLLSAVLTIAAASFIAACGGGGGGGGGPTQPPPPSVTFIPAGAAGSNSVSLQSGTVSLTTLELNLTLQAVPGLYGLAFDLDFPAGALRFAGASEGSALASAGVPLLVQTSESSSGHLVVGLSRTGNSGGIASASGIAMTLRFEVIAAGGGAIAFTRNHALDHAGGEVLGVTWTGGSVTVVR